MTHICVSKLTIIGSDNGLSPGRRQAIIWNNAGLLSIEPLETNFSEIAIGIQTFSFKKMHLENMSEKWRPFCLGLNVLTLAKLMAHYLKQCSLLTSEVLGESHESNYMASDLYLLFWIMMLQTVLLKSLSLLYPWGQWIKCTNVMPTANYNRFPVSCYVCFFFSRTAKSTLRFWFRGHSMCPNTQWLITRW